MKDNESQDKLIQSIKDSSFNQLDESHLANIEYFGIIFKTLSEGVALNEIVFNDQGEMIDYKILAVNDAFFKVADYKKEIPVAGSLASQLYGLEENDIRDFWDHHNLVNETVKNEFYSKLNNRHFIISTSPFVNNRFVTSFFDITERKKTEEKIFALNEFSNALISSMQDGFTVVDMNTAITEVNPAMCALTGFSREELIGQKIPHPFWPPEEYESFYNAFAKAFGGSKENYELTFMRKNGERFIVIVSPYAVKNSLGETINFAATFKDITDQKHTQAALLESELQYRLLFQNLNASFALQEIILDENGKPCDYRYLAVNNGFEKEVGLSAAEVVGKRVSDLYPESETYWLEFFGKVALTGNATHYENYSKVLNKYYEVFTYSPKKGQFALIGRDITERKKIELALAESEAQYRLLFQNLNGVFALYDALLDDQNKVYDLRYVAVNETFEKAVGLKAVDVIGKRMLEIFPKSEFRWIELFGKVAVSGAPVLYEDYSEQLDRHFEGYAFSPKKGQVAHIGRDITDRKKAEKELKDSQELLKYGLEGSGDGIWDWNILENKIFFSKSWHQIFGFEDQEITTTEAWFLQVCQEDVPKIMEAVQLHFENRKPFHQEHRFFCKDGSLKWVLIRGMVVSRNAADQPIRMIGTTTDISRIKYAEKQFIQASKLASLGEMSAGIAHEINNPLAIILGMARSLTKSRDNPEKYSEKIDAIQKAGMRISKIISGLKKFSRSPEEKSYTKCSLANIIEECLVLTNASSKKNETQVVFGLKTKDFILCEEVEIEQVLINLINNSIDAVKSLDEKWVKIDLFNVDGGVVLRVTDSGKGILLENQPRLFDPFFTTKPIGEGTGLGVSIIKGILDEHHATIKLDTNCPNTCFEIRFKKVEEPDEA